MSRNDLGQLNGQRARFRGTFVRYGSFAKVITPPVRTFVLADIADIEGIARADHLWFRLTTGFEALGDVPVGSVIEFDARVTEYVRRPFLGLPERQRRQAERGPDYRLSYPRNIEIVGGGES